MTPNEPIMSSHENEHRTSGGVPVTDELMQRSADQADVGFDTAALRKRGGRPPLGSGPAEVVPVRLDPELRAELASRADSEHTSASEVIRQALRAWLDVA